MFDEKTLKKWRRDALEHQYDYKNGSGPSAIIIKNTSMRILHLVDENISFRQEIEHLKANQREKSTSDVEMYGSNSGSHPEKTT